MLKLNIHDFRQHVCDDCANCAPGERRWGSWLIDNGSDLKDLVLLFIMMCVYLSSCSRMRTGLHFNYDYTSNPFFFTRDKCQHENVLKVNIQLVTATAESIESVIRCIYFTFICLVCNVNSSRYKYISINSPTRNLLFFTRRYLQYGHYPHDSPHVRMNAF